MAQVSSTLFGLAIAYFLPGLVSLFSLTFWSSEVAGIFRTFLTVESNVGLFLLVLSAALVVGLIVQAFRWWFFERFRQRLEPEDFAKLSSTGKLPAYTAAIDENFRHHQFLGGMSIGLPLLLVGWFVENWDTFSFGGRIGLIVFSALIECALVSAAWEAYSKFYKRAKAILDGGTA